MPKPQFEDNNISEMIRVNHAGEYGAKRIYQGQISFTKCLEDKKLLQEMLDHELVHLDYFTNALKTYKVRPTFLLPIWHKLGYALGAVSAKLGIKAAMLVTQNVEEVIEEHYMQQINALNQKGQLELAKDIKTFMDDEILHKDIAEKYNDISLAKSIASILIQGFCRAAIFLSKKI